MISLEQVKALETRVEKAVGLIETLRSENASLRAGLDGAEYRVLELEERIDAFQKDQARIEEGIVQALRKLDVFEDGLHAQPAPSQAESKPAAPRQNEARAQAEPTRSVATKADAEVKPESASEAAEAKPAGSLDIF